VIFDPGYVCIGAYLIEPVCIIHGRAKLPLAAAGASCPAIAITLGGPAVPETASAPVTALFGRTPVMPLREKRGEKLVTRPPVEATEMILKKLKSRQSVALENRRAVQNVLGICRCTASYAHRDRSFGAVPIRKDTFIRD
jgi:hypothetical protein